MQSCIFNISRSLEHEMIITMLSTIILGLSPLNLTFIFQSEITPQLLHLYSTYIVTDIGDGGHSFYKGGLNS